jgi:hypothetical protein
MFSKQNLSKIFIKYFLSRVLTEVKAKREEVQIRFFKLAKKSTFVIHIDSLLLIGLLLKSRSGYQWKGGRHKERGNEGEYGG